MRKSADAARWIEIKSKLLPRLAVLMAVAVGLTAVAVARSLGPFWDRPRVTTSPATEPQQPRPSRGPNPSAGPNQAKPAYEGPWGDFIVGRHQGSSLPPCPRPLRRAKNEKIRASELYSPVFGDNLEGFVAECADGKIIGIEIYGTDILSRAYFVGKPIVPYQVPLDLLKLLTVAGKPAIAQLPMPPLSWPLRLTVIERFPSGNQPGILVAIADTDKSIEEASELLAQIMGVQR